MVCREVWNLEFSYCLFHIAALAESFWNKFSVFTRFSMHLSLTVSSDTQFSVSACFLQHKLPAQLWNINFSYCVFSKCILHQTVPALNFCLCLIFNSHTAYCRSWYAISVIACFSKHTLHQAVPALNFCLCSIS